MAEISIQEKERKPIWPWFVVLIILIFVALAIYWFSMHDEDRNEDEGVAAITEEPMVADTSSFPLVPLPVSTFFSFAHDSVPAESHDEGDGEMGVHHEFTGKGLRYLANAIDAVMRSTDLQDVEAIRKMQEINDASDRLQQDWESLNHADTLQAAFKKANDVLRKLQQTEFSFLESQVTELEQIVSEFKPGKMTLEQRTLVKRYFRTSSEILQQMARSIDEQ
ncbi:MAG: hypothetical protein WD077_15765 [Bacteroidia bacterium]